MAIDSPKIPMDRQSGVWGTMQVYLFPKNFETLNTFNTIQPIFIKFSPK